MAIKAGQILHAMNQFVVDRIQTGGAGNLNIPQERIYELGNYQSVGIVRDIPDLSFSLDVLDVGTQVEGLICGATDPDSDALGTDGVTGTRYDLLNNQTVDIVSPFKSAQGAFDVVRGVAVPQLAVEQIQYRYGMTSNAGETFTLRGDSIYYVPGAPYQASYTGDGTTTVYHFATGSPELGAGANVTALKYTESGVDMYALNVSVDGVRLTRGIDYTDTSTTVTFVTAPANNAKVRIVFGSATSATYPQTIHGSPTALAVRPAAIRGKDILVYVGKDTQATPAPFRWGEVQSVSVDWRVTLEADYEFGNAHAVARDYVSAPDLSGSLEIKPISAATLFAKLNQITGVTSTDVVGPQSSVTLPLWIELKNPDTGGTTAQAKGTVLKTLYIPDARFTIPGYEGRQSQKLVNTLDWSSDTGVLQVFKGLPYGT
jgi:hypothetical protein